jgi:hypothetical protein
VRRFASLVHDELTARRVVDGYEVSAAGELVGWLEDPKTTAEARCVARDGDWRFARLRSGDIEATMGTAVIARYESKLLPGGAIVLPDESRLRLRPPVLGDAWRLRRGRNEVVLEVAPERHGWAIRLNQPARELQPLSLIALFAFHAVLTELDRPAGGDGPSPPGPVGF